MIVPYFLDTNILIYAALPKNGGEAKRKAAAKLIDQGRFGTSTQVLQEFYWTATRKGDPPLSSEEALEWVEMLDEQPCVTVNSSLVKIGIEKSVRFRISYWDGVIIAAAESIGASVIYTEDLNHGQTYGSLLVMNPFMSAPPPTGFHEPPQTPLI